MTPELLSALGLISPFILLILGWVFTRAVKTSEKIHAIDVRLTKNEEKTHAHANRLQTNDVTLRDIQANMVRREDFAAGLEALGQRIDDALRK